MLDGILFSRTNWSFVGKNNLTSIPFTKVIQEFFYVESLVCFDLAMVTLQVAHVFLLSKDYTNKNDKNRS